MGYDECGAGKKIQSLQNHTGTCCKHRTDACKMKEWGTAELCTVSGEMQLASCLPIFQQGGPAGQGALWQGETILSLALLLCLHFSFPERGAREEIKW